MGLTVTLLFSDICDICLLIIQQIDNNNSIMIYIYIYITYYVQDTIQSACHILTHLSFKTVLCCMSNYYHFHFTDEEAISQKV